MNRKIEGIRGCVAGRHAQTRQLVRRIEDLGYAVRTDDCRAEFTCVASNPRARRALVSAGDSAFRAVHNVAVVLGLVHEAGQEDSRYMLRSSNR